PIFPTFPTRRSSDLFGQHSLLARFDQLETTETEEVIAQHAEHQSVAVVAGLDAVDGMAEPGGEALDVGKTSKAALVGVGGDGEGVLGSGEIGADDLHRALRHVALA